MSASATATSFAGRRRLRAARRRALHMALAAVMLAAVGFEVARDSSLVTAGLRAAVRGRLELLPAVAVAQVASMVAMAGTQHILLGSGRPVRLAGVLRVVYAANAVAAVLPGGRALSALYTARCYRRAGQAPGAAWWTSVMSGLLSVFALAILSLVSPAGSPAVRLWIVILAVVTALGAAVAASRSSVLARPAALGVAAYRRILRLPAADSVATAADALRVASTVRVGWAGWLAAVMTSFLNWLLDAAALFVAFLAIGVPAPMHVLLPAYAAAQAACLVRLSPGGIGVFEAAYTATAVLLGAHGAEAVAAVVLARVVWFASVLGPGVALYFTDPLRLPEPLSREEP